MKENLTHTHTHAWENMFMMMIFFAEEKKERKINSCVRIRSLTQDFRQIGKKSRKFLVSDAIVWRKIVLENREAILTP